MYVHVPQFSLTQLVFSLHLFQTVLYKNFVDISAEIHIGYLSKFYRDRKSKVCWMGVFFATSSSSFYFFCVFLSLSRMTANTKSATHIIFINIAPYNNDETLHFLHSFIYRRQYFPCLLVHISCSLEHVDTHMPIIFQKKNFEKNFFPLALSYAEIVRRCLFYICIFDCWLIVVL